MPPIRLKYEAQTSDSIRSLISCSHRRTSVLRKNHEGLVIAWRREDLQAFRVEHADLNDATKEEHDVSQSETLPM